MAPIAVAPGIDDIVLGSTQDAMRLVGAIAILAWLQRRLRWVFVCMYG